MTIPTSNPVPSSAPQDLLFNAALLDQAVTGTGATVTDRLGTSRMSMQGAIDTLKAFTSLAKNFRLLPTEKPQVKEDRFADFGEIDL